MVQYEHEYELKQCFIQNKQLFDIQQIKLKLEMFNARLTPNQEQMRQLLLNSRSKGQYFMDIYSSHQRNQALTLLTHLEPKTVLQIKEDIQRKYRGRRVPFECDNFLSYFYSTYRYYKDQLNKRENALWGLIALTFVDILCAGILFKIGHYLFRNSDDNVEVSILTTVSKYLGLFALGSFCIFGVFFSSMFVLYSRNKYIQTRTQVIKLQTQMEQRMQEVARRHQD